MNQQQPNEQNSTIANAVLVIAILIGVGQWLSAMAAALLTTRSTLKAGFGEALLAIVNMRNNWATPADAWPEQAAQQLPGPWLYWPVAFIVHLLLVVAALRAFKMMNPSSDAIDERNRFGVDTQARTANRADLRPLRSRKPEPGRFYLGVSHGKELATEPPSDTKRHRTTPGAAAIVAPSRSGKTVATANSANQWEGPAILSSVKRDLIDGTTEQRSAMGEVRFYDPKGISGHQSNGWTPLERAKSRAGSVQMARLMISATGHDKNGTGGFWSAQAEGLLGGLLWLAANTDHTIADVAYWISAFDHPQEGNPGIVGGLLRAIAKSDSDIADEAKQVQRQLKGIWDMDTRMASSYYVSARLAVTPWTDPIVAETAITNEIDLEWLVSGDNTLYLVAPVIDQANIAPALGGLIGDLVTQAMDRVDRQRQTLGRPLLLVLDEAANTPITQLPQWASLLTGYGIQLVTIWQSKSQIDALYGTEADALLTNHRSKIFYGGMTDLATIKFLVSLLGNEYQPGFLAQAGYVDPRTAAPTSVPLTPANVLRGIKVGQALLLHGSLPPVHLTTTHKKRRFLERLWPTTPRPQPRSSSALRASGRSKLHPARWWANARPRT